MDRQVKGCAALSRRRFFSFGIAGIATALAAACGAGQREEPTVMREERQRQAQQGAAAGLLAARPGPATGEGPHGLHPLGLDDTRDGLLYVPTTYQAGQAAPLALLLHGAGGMAEHGIGLLQSVADDTGLILLAPVARRQTWDVIMGGYGPDISFIDQALAQTFGRYTVDPARIVVGGFSDGASYALSVGIINGHLFTHIMAFSPGFMAPTEQQDAPRIFISHGIHDDVLPIDRCSRRIVPKLQRAGYDVRYREFDGPHTVPPPIVAEAMDWFMATNSSPHT